MSEQKQFHHNLWSAEKIEPPKSPKISRRTLLKVIGATAVGGAILTGKKALEDLGLINNRQPANENFFYAEAKRLKQATQAAPTPFQPQAPTPEAGATPEPTPTPETYYAWEFANIDLSNSKEKIDMGFFIGSDTVLVPAFTPISFYEGVLESGAFSPDNNTGLTYLDSLNRKILNLHSGRKSSLDSIGYTAWQLQNYLETIPQNGVKRYPREVKEILNNKVRGSEVIIKQGGTTPSVRVSAAVRVPPTDVSESQNHVGDIVEWLGKTYPNSGFADLGKDHETLVIKFCGRILSGEAEDPSRPSYQQSRFFIALKQS